MVKKTGGRDINPADAFRKQQRAKEIARNKKERKFQRDASTLKAQPEAIKKELTDVLDMEVDGKMNATLRLKKRALQTALEVALKKKKEAEVVQPPGGPVHGVSQPVPRQLTHYTASGSYGGPPPPGWPPQDSAAEVPLPKMPPLPQGPVPQHMLEQQGHALPLPDISQAAQLHSLEEAGDFRVVSAPLPPPEGPPPPGLPEMPPQFMMPYPVPQYHPPPPSWPPPPPSAPHQAAKPTILGAATAPKRILAHKDKRVTSMVPASVRVQRQQATSRPAAPRPAASFVAPGAALAAPRPAAGAQPAAASEDQKYMEYLSEMSNLGAFEQQQ